MPAKRLPDAPMKTAGHLDQKISQRADVERVLALRQHPETGRWFYLVRCPRAWSYPKYSIGSCDASGSGVKREFRCGTPRTAWTEWRDLMPAE